VLAFVTENNASFRRLVDADSSLFPTHYLFSGGNTTIPESNHILSPVLDISKGIETILERLRKYQTGTAHFTYTLKEWQSQFLDRPGEIEFLSVNDTSLAIIEKKGDFDRVLILSLNEGITFGNCIKALLKRALNNRRKLFLFTTSKFLKDECVTLGFEHSPGYLTTLVANEKELLRAYPSVSGHPKNIANKLYEPNSRWYIGSWDVQSGDRM
jgi:hypothetical protein